MSELRSAGEIYQQLIAKKDSLHSENIHTQLNELRAIYELDKAELEAEKRLAALRRQRLIISGMAVACLALALIVALVAWSRKRIAQKNRVLYRQLKEQYLVEKQLERENRSLVGADNPADVPGKDEELFERLDRLMKEQRLFVNSELKRSEVAQKIGISDRALHDFIKK